MAQKIFPNFLSGKGCTYDIVDKNSCISMIALCSVFKWYAIHIRERHSGGLQILANAEPTLEMSPFQQ